MDVLNKGVYLKNIHKIYLYCIMTKLSKKDIFMYYHTAIRNVGLYTSVSVGMLGYSRFYRGKIKIYNIAFILISLSFLLFSMLINYHIIKAVSEMKTLLSDEESLLEIDHLSRLPYITFITNMLVFSFGIYTLTREI